MTRFLLLFLLLFAFVPALCAQEHDSWVKFSSEAGRFSVLMPEIPVDDAKTNESANGPYTTHLFMKRTPKGVFLIGWVDYDPSFNFAIQSELEANRDNFVRGVKATLLGTTKINLNGNPGLEFTAETADVRFKSRVYIIGRRPYQLIAGTYKDQDDTANVNRFFSSFELRQQ